MMLEAVWFRDGKEVEWVDPVLNIVCSSDMNGIEDIEVFNGYAWYTYEDVVGGADDFVIRVKKD